MREFINIVETMLDGSHAPLYHSTNLISAIEIVKEDELKTKKAEQRDIDGPNGVVSLTRSFIFAKIWRTHDVIFVLDQAKLRANYRVLPYDYFNPNQKDILGTKYEKNKRTEAEEFVTRSIKPLSKYLIEILVFKKGIVRVTDVILRNKTSVVADPSKPFSSGNIKSMRTYKGVNDPTIANNIILAPWIDRKVLLRNPKTRIV